MTDAATTQRNILTRMRVVRAIRSQNGFAGVVFDESALREDIGFDSLDVVSLAVRLEDSENFDVQITDDDIENWRTVGDVVKTMERKIG